MFRASSAHPQEVNVVNCTCMQPLVFSFSAGGRLVHLLRGDVMMLWCRYIYHITNVLLFKFRCNIFIGVRIINLEEPHVLYIGQAYRYPPDVAFYTYIFFSTTTSTEYFNHAAHSPFFSSKCRLFHNATFFGSCIIHILHTECAKI